MNGIEFWAGLDRTGFVAARFLLAAVWQSSILLAAIAALGWMLRKRRASIRRALWISGLLIGPLLPLITAAALNAGGPQAPVRVLPRYEAAPMITGDAATASDGLVGSVGSDRVNRWVGGGNPAGAPVTRAMEYSILDYPWALALAGYAVGFAACLGWMLLGRLHIGRWIRRTMPVTDERVLSAFAAAGKAVRLSRSFLLLASARVPAPMSYGVLHPVVLLPDGLAEGISDDELRGLAVHELAHIKRYDSVVLLAVGLVRAALFFHPLVWLAGRHISSLSEQAADDAVLESSLEPIPYAKLLARLAEELPRRALSTEFATGILFSRGAFLRRVEMILSDRRHQVRRLTRFVFAGAALGLLVSVGLALAVPLEEKPPAVPQSGERAESPRRFVRIVTDGETVTFEGENTTWDELPALLEKVTDRKNTVLEIAVASDEISWREVNEVKSRAGGLADQFGFEYSSFIGVHPLRSREASSEGARGEVSIGDVVELVLRPQDIVERKVYDVETGQLVDGGLSDAYLHWAKLAGPSDAIGIVTHGMAIQGSDGTQSLWHAQTLDELPRFRDDFDEEFIGGSSVRLPISYAFRTRQGTVGLLEYVKTEGPDAHVRYRVISRTPPSAAGASESGAFRADSELPLSLAVDLFQAQWMKVGRKDDLIVATIHGKMTSGPKRKWLMTVRLLNAVDKEVAEGVVLVENSGIIAGLPALVEQDTHVTLIADWEAVCRAEKYVLTIDPAKERSVGKASEAGPPLTGTVSVSGVSRNSGDVRAETVIVAGAGRVNGNVLAKKVEASGASRFDGDVKAEVFNASGASHVKGNVEAVKISCTGASEFEKGCIAETVECTGATSFGGTVKGKSVRVTGALKVEGDVIADEFQFSGTIKVGGEITADRIVVKLSKENSSAKEIHGGTVLVERLPESKRKGGLLGSLFGGKEGAGVLEISNIAGTDVSLENVVADKVIGRKVTIGPGCRIGTVEYMETIAVDPEAQVAQQVRTAGLDLE
jgi:cytoskeletal protein CcmA (bactofilin family)/Zn-dependent protease with chaperone function